MNNRYIALRTGKCVMCEDCPDGCPLVSPEDSRNCDHEPPTNYDRIRAMSVEEMAADRIHYDNQPSIVSGWQGDFGVILDVWKDGEIINDGRAEALQDEIEWLNSPVEVEG